MTDQTEAPGRIRIQLDSPGDEWGRLWTTDHTTAYVPDNQYRYIRTDLARPPQEMVEEVRRKVTEHPYTRGERIHWENETKALLRQFLAWMDGNSDE